MGVLILFMYSFAMKLEVIAQVWFMLVCRGLTLFWCWSCFWRFVFIGVDGSPRLGFVFMSDYDERGVWIFFWVFHLYTTSFALLLLYSRSRSS